MCPPPASGLTSPWSSASPSTKVGEGKLYTSVSFTEDGELILKAVTPTVAAIPAEIALPMAITAAVQAAVLRIQT